MRLLFLTVVFLFVSVLQVAGQDHDLSYLGTFAIVARDPVSGELGMGVQSRGGTIAAGSRAITAKGGLTVIGHIASAYTMYGAVGLELLGAGMEPKQALDMMLRSDEGRSQRQVAIIDIQGRTAAWSGSDCSDWKGHKCGTNYCAMGNILVGPEVVAALGRSFESSSGPLAERLLAAIDAGQDAGGDARGMRQAALMVVKPLAGWDAGFSDRVIDIRVDDHDNPNRELRRILNVYRSGQMLTQATAKLKAGDLKGALEITMAARDKSQDNDRAWTALASLHLKMGNKAEALAAIQRSIELNPFNRRQLPLSPDFQSLRGDPDFERLVRPR